MLKKDIEKRIETLKVEMNLLECGDEKNIELQNEYKRLLKELNK